MKGYKSYSVSDIQDYFEYILKDMEKTLIILQSIENVKKIQNRITFKVKIGYYLELIMTETMKLLGNTKSKINKDKNGENMAHLEIAGVVLIQSNIVNNKNLQDSRLLYTFVPNKSFVQLSEISLKKFIFSFRIFMYWSMIYWSKF